MWKGVKTTKPTFHKYFRQGNMTNRLSTYDFLFNNNTFWESNFNGLEDIKKYTMDPSSKTRAGSLQSFIEVVYGYISKCRLLQCDVVLN